MQPKLINMKKLLTLCAIVLSITLISAKKDPEYVKTWELKTMNSVDVQVKCILKINPAGQFVGKGICNNFTGAFVFDGKKKVKCNENIAMTKMFCKDTEALENELLSTLKKVDGYEIDDDVLYLKSKKQTVLTFAKVIEPKPEKVKKKKN
jgi:heat shock protein HslJ